MKLPVIRIWQRYAIIMIVIILAGTTPVHKEYAQSLRQAEAAIQEQNFQEASAAYARAAEFLPWRTDLWENAGKYALQAGAPRQAIFYLDKVVQRGKIELGGCLILAEAYLQDGKNDLAVEYWEKALEKGAQSMQVYPLMLNAYLCNRDYPGAISTLISINDLEPTAAKWSYQLGLLLATQEPDLAVSYLERAAWLDPALDAEANRVAGAIETSQIVGQTAYVLLEAGRALAAMGEWELASTAFRQAISQDENLSEAWAYYGESLQHLQQPLAQTNPSGKLEILPSHCYGDQRLLVDQSKEVEQALHRAVEIKPDSLAAHLFLALFYNRHGDLQSAIESLLKAKAIDPDNPIIEIELGNTFALEGDLRTGLSHMQQAHRVSHEDPIFTRLVINFILQYRYEVEDSGLPLVSKLVASYPDNAENMTLLGQVQMLLENYWSAEIAYTAAIKIDPHYAPVYLHLGELFYLQGKLAQAEQFMEKAKALSPTSLTGEQAQYLLDQYFP